MGSFFAKALKSITGSNQMKILMTGLGAAGKTTILYKLKLGEVVMTIPTIGFNVESVQYKNIQFNVFDVGGKDRIRVLERLYYKDTTALIWVVGSLEWSFMDSYNHTAKEELQFLLNQELLSDAILLVFANKQDLPDAKPLEEIVERLELDKITDRKWFIQATSAITGDGLYEGLDWLSYTLNGKEYEADTLTEYTSWICKENHEIVLENRKKSILLISAWVRDVDCKYKLKIMASLTRLIHQFFRNTDDDADYYANYAYYG